MCVCMCVGAWGVLLEHEAITKEYLVAALLCISKGLASLIKTTVRSLTVDMGTRAYVHEISDLVCNLGNLQSLEFVRCSNTPQYSLVALEEDGLINLVASLDFIAPKLTALSISMQMGVSNTIGHMIAESLTEWGRHLDHLQLSDDMYISDSDIAAVVRRHTGLKSLVIENCPCVTSNVLSELKGVEHVQINGSRAWVMIDE
jgi:hypothetical protein